MLTQIMRHADPFMRLKNSKFRRELHLNLAEKAEVEKKGLAQLSENAFDMINIDLNDPDNSSHPPKKGPIFKAMHATACCCRKCLFKWHRIPKYRDLTEEEAIYLTSMIIRWIKKETKDSDLLYNF